MLRLHWMSKMTSCKIERSRISAHSLTSEAHLEIQKLSHSPSIIRLRHGELNFADDWSRISMLEGFGTARSQADRYGTTAPYPPRLTLSIHFHRSNSLSVAHWHREESLRRHLRDVMLIKDHHSTRRDRQSRLWLCAPELRELSRPCSHECTLCALRCLMTVELRIPRRGRSHVTRVATAVIIYLPLNFRYFPGTQGSARPVIARQMARN